MGTKRPSKVFLKIIFKNILDFELRFFYLCTRF